MNKKRLESFLNKNFGISRTDDGLIVCDLAPSSFIILGPEDVSFYLNGRECLLEIGDISGIEIVDNRLNIYFWGDDSEKTLSINLSDMDDCFVSERLSEAVFRIDVDDDRIKRFFVRATDQGTAIRSIRDQYPDLSIVGVSKFSEANKLKESSGLQVDKEAVDGIFQVYSDPDTDKTIRLGIDWTMSNLFGSNWPSIL